MDKIIFVLVFAWLGASGTTALKYWFMPNMTPNKFQEAIDLCGDRGLRHINLSDNFHTVVCEDDGEYSLSAKDKKEE